MPTFDQIYNAFQQSGASKVMPLSDFAKVQNYVTGSNDYNPAVLGTFGQAVKQGSYWLNQGLDQTGVPEALGDVGQKAFEQLGATPHAGYELGHNLPRSAVNFAPMMTAAALAPESGGLSLLALGGTGALQGAETYEQGGTPGQVALSAVTPAIGAGVGKVAGKLLMPGSQALLESSPFLANARQYLGEQAASIGGMEAAGRIFGDNQTPFFSKDNLLQMTLGNLPFMAEGAIKGYMHGGFVSPPEGKSITYDDVRKAAADASLEDALKNKSITQQLPSVVDQTDAKDTQTQIYKQQMEEVQSKGADPIEAFENEGGTIPQVKDTTLMGVDARTAAQAPVVDQSVTPIKATLQGVTIPDVNNLQTAFSPEGYKHQALPFPDIKPGMSHDEIIQTLQNYKDVLSVNPTNLSPENLTRALKDTQTHIDQVKVLQVRSIQTAEKAVASLPTPRPDDIQTHEQAQQTLLQSNVVSHEATGDPITDADLQTRAEHLTDQSGSDTEITQTAISSVAEETKEIARQTLRATLERVRNEQMSPDILSDVGGEPGKPMATEVGKKKMTPEELADFRRETGKKGGRPKKSAYSSEDLGAANYYSDFVKRESKAPTPEGQRILSIVKPAFEKPEQFFTKGGTINMRPDTHIAVLRAFKSFMEGTQGMPLEEKVGKLTNQLNKSINRVADKPVGLTEQVSLDPETIKEIEQTAPDHDGSPDARRANEATADHVVNLMYTGAMGDILKSASDIDSPLYRAILANPILSRMVENAELRLPQAVGKSSPGVRQVVRQMFDKNPKMAREFLAGLAKDAKVAGNTGGTGTLRQSPFFTKAETLFETRPNGKDYFAGRPLIDGKIDRQIFDSVVNKQVSKDELALWKIIDPSAFGDKEVNVKQLVETMRDQPQVKVSKLDAQAKDSSNSKGAVRGRIQHELETLGYRMSVDGTIIQPNREVLQDRMAQPERIRQLLTELQHNEVRPQEARSPQPWTGRGIVDAYSPDYLKGNATLQDGKQKAVWAGDISANAEDPERIANKKAVLLKEGYSDEDATNLAKRYVSTISDSSKFHSQHYPGPEGQNQLGFVRGVVHEYQPGAKLPDGSVASKVERVMEVNEVQSDWAAQRNNKIKSAEGEIERIKAMLVAEPNASNNAIRRQRLSEWTQKVADLKTQPPDHPLLPHWEPIVLKSAIDQAIKLGATKLVVSDAESAMMTQGHDQHLPARREVAQMPDGRWTVADTRGGSTEPLYATKAEAEAAIPQNQPSQSSGMRAAYDERVPNILSKLTGEKGIPVEMGVHEKAKDSIAGIRWDDGSGNDALKGSPIFRDSTGSPKTLNTGRQFDLSKLSQDYQGFPLVRADRGGLGSLSRSETEQMGEGQNGGEMDLHPTSYPAELRPSLEHIFGATLLKQGVSGDQARVLTQKFLGPLREILPLQGVQFDELIRDTLSPNAPTGLATVQGPLRQIWLGSDIDPRILKANPNMQARALSLVLAHEGGHAMQHLADLGLLDKTTQMHFDRMQAFFESRTSPENYQLIRTMAESLLPDNWARVSKIFVEPANASEAMADAHAIWAMSLAGPNIDASLSGILMPKPIRTWFSTLTGFVRKLVGAVKSSLNIRPEYGDVARISKIVDQFNSMRKGFAEAETKAQEFSQFFGLDQYSYGPLQMSSVMKDVMGLAASRREYGPENFGDRLLGKVSEYTEGIDQLARRIPTLGGAAWAVLDMPTHMKQLTDRMLAPLVAEKDTQGNLQILSKEREAQLKMVMSDVPTNRMVSDIQLWEQKQLDSGTSTPFDFSKPSNSDLGLAQRYMYMSPEQKGAIQQYITGQRESNRVAQQSILDFQDKINGVRLAYVIATRDMSLFGQAKDLGQQAYEATKMKQQLDQMSQAPVGTVDLNAMNDLENQYDQMVMGLQKAVQKPDAYQAMMDYAGSMATEQSKLQDFMSKRATFASRIIKGSFIMRGYDAQGKQVGMEAMQSAGDKTDAQEILKAKGAVTFKGEDVRKGWDVHIDDEMKEMLDHAENSWMQKLQQWLGPGSIDALNEFIGDNPLGSEIDRLVKASRIVEPGSRGQAKGPEIMDMVDAHRNYINVLSRLLTSRLAKANMSFETENPELAKFSSQMKQIKDAMKQYQTPDSEMGRAFTKFMATYYLGLNVPTSMAIMGHGLFTLLPESVSRTNSVVKSTKMLMGTVADITKYYLSNLKSAGRDEWNGWEDPGEKANFANMITNGLLQRNAFSEDSMDTEGLSAVKLRQIGQEGATSKVLGGAANLWNNYSNFTMKFFEQFAKFNARVAGLMGYRMGVDQGMNHEQSMNYSKEFTITSTFASGKAGRPVGLFRGEDHTLGQIAYALQRYSMGCMAMFGRYAQHSLMSEASAREIGLPTQGREAARKALLTATMVRFGAAGLLGLPGMGAMNALLEKITGQGIGQNIYQAMGSTLDQDDKEGSILADTVAHGFANALLARIGMPVDVASKFAMAGLPGMSSQDVFDPGSIFGPSASLMRTMIEGVSGYAKDRDMANMGKTLMPPAFRKAVDLWANGDATDKAGRPIGSTEMEKTAYALGFQTQRQTKTREFGHYTDLLNQQKTRAENRMVSKVMDMWNSGDIPGAQEEIQNQVDAGQGKVDGAHIAQEVAKKITEHQFPADIRAKPTAPIAGPAADILRGMGIQLPPSQEELRESQQKMIAQTLGAGNHTPRNSWGGPLGRASMEDIFTSQHPSSPFQMAFQQ